MKTPYFTWRFGRKTITILGPLSSSIWLILAVKLPLVLLIGLLVWWASRGQSDEESSSDDDGGLRLRPRPHPRRPFPRPPRRGPHGDPSPVPPARVRPVRARSRTLRH
jgi:hypothetical protein